MHTHVPSWPARQLAAVVVKFSASTTVCDALKYRTSWCGLYPLAGGAAAENRLSSLLLMMAAAASVGGGNSAASPTIANIAAVTMQCFSISLQLPGYASDLRSQVSQCASTTRPVYIISDDGGSRDGVHDFDCEGRRRSARAVMVRRAASVARDGILL